MAHLYRADKSELQEVFQDTISIYLDPSQRDVTVHRPLIYSDDTLEDVQLPKSIYDKPAVIKVINQDTLDLALKLIQNKCPGQQKTDNSKVTILNMASDYKPCGGALNGAKAQEECIARRSNLFMLLPPQIYPWHRSLILYNQGLDVCKDSNYNLCDPFQVNCISIAGVRNPKLDANGQYKDKRLRDAMKNKINNLFKVAYLNKQDTLVLGAIGCGAFGNPPHEVATMFVNLIEEYKYLFKNIYFAVLSHGRNENYDIFHTYVELPFSQNK